MKRADLHGLSKTRSASGIAQAEVPGLWIPPAVLLHLGSCSAVAHYDAWDNGFFAVVRGRRTAIAVEGTALVPEHILKLSEEPRCHEATGGWVLDYWAGNYFHWVVYCLPKVLVMVDAGLGSRLLLPSRSHLMAVIEDSVRCVGGTIEGSPRLLEGVTSLGDLAVVEGGRFGPQLLHRLRERVSPSSSRRVPPGRRLFLSREGAQWRRLRNQKEVEKSLEPHGFEVVRLEELAFREQVDIFGDAAVVIAPHGAGLANIVWCPPGCTVIELGSSRELNPDYYRLALTMGHRYWLVETSLEGDPRPAYADMRVDARVLAETVRLALG